MKRQMIKEEPFCPGFSEGAVPRWAHGFGGSIQAINEPPGFYDGFRSDSLVFGPPVAATEAQCHPHLLKVLWLNMGPWTPIMGSGSLLFSTEQTVEKRRDREKATLRWVKMGEAK